MRVGLFGGSFDPVHQGHLLLAARALEDAKLDRLLFLPCRQSPHKEAATCATAEQRCEMIRLAIAEHLGMELDRLELEREGPSYSWQTAEAMHQRYRDGELYWILGSDQWEVIETWARAETLAELVTFLVFPRGNQPQKKPDFRMQVLDYEHPANSTAARESLEAAREMLPEQVFEYALKEGIYGWGEDRAGD